MGVTGLLNSPSAQFSKEGTVKIGGNFLNTNMTPQTWDYNTFNFFVNITFLSFLEAAITNTAFDLWNNGKFSNVDRAVCLRLRVFKEGRYTPAFVVGSNDLLTSNTSGYFDPSKGNKYFGTHYFALSKHINLNSTNLGFHAAYNLLSSTKQTIKYPISGGITLSPSFAKQLTLIAEYDTRDFNLGGSLLIFKHLYFQMFVQDLKYISFGAHFQFNLL